MSRRIALVDPMSYNNLALYDISLLKGFQDIEPDISMTFFGNIKIDLDIPESIRFVPIFTYGDKNLIGMGFSYLKSLFGLALKLKRTRPDIIHFQWLKIPFADILMFLFLRLYLPNSSIIHTAHNIQKPERDGL